MREWRAANPIRDAFNHLKDSARRRKKFFGIEFKEFAQWCLQTGYVELKGCNASCAQIDRIKNEFGYTMDNIQILTCSQNTAKGNRERHAMQHLNIEEPF